MKAKNTIINIVLAMNLLALCSCEYFPQLAQAMDDIETDRAIMVEIDKAAMQKETDVVVNVSILNKDQPTPISK